MKIPCFLLLVLAFASSSALSLDTGSTRKGKPSLRHSSAREVANLKHAFAALDFNGNGTLNLVEFSRKPRALPGAFERRFRRVDRNRNHSISLQEFAEYRKVRLPRGTRPPIDKVKQEFSRLDGDGDGIISVEEVAVAMTFVDGSALDDYFSGLDRNDSGGVDLGEWRAGYDVPVVNPDPPTHRDLARYIGLAVAAAKALANSEGRPSRVVRVDGTWLPVTADYNPQRLNFVVNGGIVRAVTAG